MLGHNVDFVQDTGGSGQLMPEAHFSFLGYFPTSQASNTTGPENTFETLIRQVKAVRVLPFLVGKPVTMSEEINRNPWQLIFHPNSNHLASIQPAPV
jgi:hypothetical protein